MKISAWISSQIGLFRKCSYSFEVLSEFHYLTGQQNWHLISKKKLCCLPQESDIYLQRPLSQLLVVLWHTVSVQWYIFALQKTVSEFNVLSIPQVIVHICCRYHFNGGNRSSVDLGVRLRFSCSHDSICILINTNRDSNQTWNQRRQLLSSLRFCLALNLLIHLFPKSKYKYQVKQYEIWVI